MTLPRLFAGLGTGIIVLSFASIIIRLLPLPSLVIAAGRLGLASVILAPLFWFRVGRRIVELRRVSWGLVLLSGILLAAHFGLWIESLQRTSVASSVMLVALNPIFVAVLAPLLLKERLNWRLGLAVALGAVGAVVISLPRLQSPGSTLGNLLAVGGAVCAAGYLLAGRRIRPGLSLVSYIYIVYTISAIMLIGVALLTGERFTGFRPQVYGLLLLLAVGPQLVGHTSLNWALRYLKAPVVAMAVMGEPIGATILAWLILGQGPTLWEVLGGAIVCTGIYLAATS
ncbi:MAG: DMT family transporter [candidate division WOR-3 bacterium]